jgi:hypothetical protein
LLCEFVSIKNIFQSPEKNKIQTWLFIKLFHWTDEYGIAALN